MVNFLEKFKYINTAFPEKVAVIHQMGRRTSKNTSFAELDGISSEIADLLRSRGVRRGDFIGVYCNKSIEHIAAIIGILKAGAAFYSINHRLKLPQLKYILDAAGSQILFIDSTSLLNFKTLKEFAVDRFRLIYIPNDKPSPVHEKIITSLKEQTTIDIFPRLPVQSRLSAHSHHILKQDVGFVLFTSGSTGKPNGVMISHQDLYNRAMTECDDFSLSHNDRLLSLLPFSFDVGCNQLFTSLSTGCTLVILNSWLPQDICSAIQEHKITGISAVPAIWSAMLETQDHETIQSSFGSVRYITVSGGDLPILLLLQLKALLPNVNIFKTYGQTETFRSGLLYPHEFEKKTASVGRPVAGTDVFIITKTGKQAAPDEPGEIVHRGDGMMKGYMGDTVRTNKKIRRNPLQNPSSLDAQYAVFTGDIGKIDQDGYLYILGRQDKMIKTSGYRVYPKEVCDQLLTHPDVKDVAVFGVRDDKIGNSIFCELQLKANSLVSEEDIRLYLASRLPAYMIPVKIVFVETFPRTPTGKIKLAEIEKRYNV